MERTTEELTQLKKIIFKDTVSKGMRVEYNGSGREWVLRKSYLVTAMSVEYGLKSPMIVLKKIKDVEDAPEEALWFYADLLNRAEEAVYDEMRRKKMID